MVRITLEFSSILVGDPSPLARHHWPYLVHVVWFPSYLPLEGTGRIHNFGL
jgi:hypothetical protein